jgi:hypothetical protein
MLKQGVKGPIDRRGFAGPLQKLHDHTIEGFVFQRFSGFQILQHRRFESAEAAGEFDGLIAPCPRQGHAAELRGALNFRHTIESQPG